MSGAALAALMALILILPPTIVVTFTVKGGTYTYQGGSTVNGAPGPIAGAGLPILALAAGIYLVRRRRRAGAEEKK